MLHSVPILKNLLIRAFVFFSYTSVDYESTGSRKIFKGMLMIVTFDQIVKTGKALQPVFISATGISMDECTDSSGYRGSLVSVFISLPKYFDRRSFNIHYVMYLIVNPFFFSFQFGVRHSTLLCTFPSTKVSSVATQHASISLQQIFPLPVSNISMRTDWLLFGFDFKLMLTGMLVLQKFA